MYSVCVRVCVFLSVWTKATQTVISKNKDTIVWRSIHIHLYAKRSEASLKKKKEIKFVKVDMHNVSYLIAGKEKPHPFN